MKTLFHKLSLPALMFLLASTILVSCSKEDVQKMKPETLGATQAAAVNFNEELAYRWAPVHYQDVDQTGDYAVGGKADYITSINFDGDWVGTNNWNNIAGNYATAAHVYYSVAETSTHWFINYAFFHPRDWTDNPFGYYLDQHENDFEGMEVVVRKDGTTYGTLQAMVTTFHKDFFSYTVSGSSWQNNHETNDGTITMENYNNESHPTTGHEAKGHGLKAYPYVNIVGDGIRYVPGRTAGVPTNPDDRNVSYKLVDVFAAGGLWEQRNNTQLFNSPSGGLVSSYGDGGANAPWAWNDGDDGDVQSGEIATDPAKMFNIYYKNLGTFDLNYIYNQYKGIN